MSVRKTSALFFAGFAVLAAGPAHAYIDPGTGSMVLQMVIAGLAAGATTIGLYWSRFTGLFRRDKQAEAETEAD